MIFGLQKTFYVQVLGQTWRLRRQTRGAMKESGI